MVVLFWGIDFPYTRVSLVVCMVGWGWSCEESGGVGFPESTPRSLRAFERVHCLQTLAAGEKCSLEVRRLSPS